MTIAQGPFLGDGYLKGHYSCPHRDSCAPTWIGSRSDFGPHPVALGGLLTDQRQPDEIFHYCITSCVFPVMLERDQ
jgi:hypothetical protein